MVLVLYPKVMQKAVTTLFQRWNCSLNLISTLQIISMNTMNTPTEFHIFGQLA